MSNTTSVTTPVFSYLTPESNRIINTDPDITISLQFANAYADRLLCLLLAQKDKFDILEAKDLGLTSLVPNLNLFKYYQMNSLWLPFITQEALQNYSQQQYQQFLTKLLIKPEIVISIYRYALNTITKNAIILAKLATKNGYEAEMQYIIPMKAAINKLLTNLLSYENSNPIPEWPLIQIIDEYLLQMSHFVYIY